MKLTALIKAAFGLKPLTKRQASLELIFAGALWGFGFVATIWALQVFSTPEVLAYRFFLAVAAGEILVLFRSSGYFSVAAKTDFLKAAPAGLLLAGMLLFQTWGMEHTTATKSGFITSLYVILVPLFNSWLFKNKAKPLNYAWALVALLGTFVLMNASFKQINQGDLLTLICSVFAAFHIIYIGFATRSISSAFRFNNFQSLWCLFGLLPFLLWQERIHLETQHIQPWMGILALALGSSLIAFYLQVRAQKILSDSTASMIFLLESPFAALFGFLILSERLSLFQASGAALIIVASVLQILSERDTKTTVKIKQ